MSGKVINLRTARKRRAREEKAQVAAENRALHGRDKAAKRRDREEREKSVRHLDGHRLETDSSDGE